MPTSQWHKFYDSHVAAPPGVLFELLADMPNYGRWLPGSPPENAGTKVSRWLVLDIAMPIIARPLRGLIIRRFDQENQRTMAAVKAYAEAHPGDSPPETISR
jgi:hypothetical protein